MNLLAFDLATNTGAAFGPVGGKPVTMSYVLGDAGSKHGARFAELRIVVRKLIKDLSPDHIALEEAIAGGAPGDANRAKLAFGYRAVVLDAAFCANITVSEVAVSSIRVHFIGAGNLPSAVAKDRTVARCERLGWPVRNDNEADAAAVWDCVRNRLTKKSTLPPNGLFDHADFAARARNV